MKNIIIFIIMTLISFVALNATLNWIEEPYSSSHPAELYK